MERRIKGTSCFIASSPRSITLAPGGLGGCFGPAHSVTHRAASGPHSSMGSGPGGWGAWRAGKEALPNSLLSWPAGVSLWGFCVLRGAGGVDDGWPFLRGLMCCLRTGKQRGVVEHRVITVGGIRCCPVLQPSGCPAASGQRAKPRVSRPEGCVSWPRPEGTWCRAVAIKGRVGNVELGRRPGGLQTSGRGSRTRGTHRTLCPRTCWGLLKGCAARPASLAGPGRGSPVGGGGQLSAALHAWASCTTRGRGG